MTKVEFTYDAIAIKYIGLTNLTFAKQYDTETLNIYLLTKKHQLRSNTLHKQYEPAKTYPIEVHIVIILYFIENATMQKYDVKR